MGDHGVCLHRDGRAEPAGDDLASLTGLLACGQVPDPGGAARRLLDKFGALDAVLAAEPERLDRVLGPPGVALLEATRQAMLAALRPASVDASPVIGGTLRLLDYLRLVAGQALVEELHVLFLRRDLALIRQEMVARGSRSQVLVEPREIVRRALDLGAAAMLIAHNHPGGSLTPSPTDLAATRSLARAAALFDIRIVDHVIVTRAGSISLVAEGLI